VQILLQLINGSLDEEDVLEDNLLLRNDKKRILIRPLRLQLDGVTGAALEVVVVDGPIQVIISKYFLRRKPAFFFRNLHLPLRFLHH